MLEQIVHPISQSDLQDVQIVEHEEKFGQLKANCMMLAQPIKGATEIPFGLFPTYCVLGDSLRVSWLATNINVFSVQTGMFQGHKVPVRVEVFTGKTKQLEAQVVELRAVTADEVDLKSAGLQQGPPGVVRISGGVMAGQLLNRVQPHYPEQARRDRATGTVVMAARVGEDGRVRRLRVVSSADPELSIAALQAVQQWTYKPYFLNGVPTEVNTTITVNFNLNR